MIVPYNLPVITPAQEARARRAIACKDWRLLRGMTFVLPDGTRTIIDQAVSPLGWVSCTRGYFSPEAWVGLGALPDLSDHATKGCLLALVREAWRCPTIYVRQGTRRVSDGVPAWEVCDLYLDGESCRRLGTPREGGVGSWGHANEEEALVSALEAAP